MRGIKKIFILFICIFGYIATVKAAPSYSLNVSQNTIENGKSVTASITVRNTGSWHIKIISSGNTYGCSNEWSGENSNGENGSKTFSTTCKASSLGKIAFTISGDITDTSYNTVYLSGTKTVNVVEPRPLSTINSLKSLSVDDYSISPEFSSDVLEYSVEVPANKNTIKINAIKTDSKSTIDGTGEKEVEEGSNRFEIVVTAENGDKRTYILVVNVKDTNPINVVINNSNYTIVKNTKNINIPDGFSEEKITIDGTEITAFKNNNIDIIIVPLKDEKGNIKFFKYENGQYKPYITVETNNINLYLIEKDNVPYNGFNKTNITINNNDLVAFKYKNLSNYYLVYGMDLSTGKEGYYLYDKNNNTFQLFDEELFNSLVNENTMYLYMFIGSLGVILICIIVILLLLKKKNKANVVLDKKEIKEKNKKQKKEEIKEETKEIKMSDNKKLDLLFEDIEEPKETKKKK